MTNTPPHPEPDRQPPSDGGLRPCPFCGGIAAHFELNEAVFKATWVSHVTHCTKCQARVQSLNSEASIILWNTRSALRDDMRFEEWELRAGLNIVLETIALKFEANDTFDLWRSDAATLVRSYKHPNTRANPPTEPVALRWKFKQSGMGGYSQHWRYHDEGDPGTRDDATPTPEGGEVQKETPLAKGDRG